MLATDIHLPQHRRPVGADYIQLSATSPVAKQDFLSFPPDKSPNCSGENSVYDLRQPPQEAWLQEGSSCETDDSEQYVPEFQQLSSSTGLSGCTVKSESRPECCVHLGTYLPSQYSSQYSSPFPHCRFSPTEGRCPPEPAAGVTHRSLFNLPSHNNFRGVSQYSQVSVKKEPSDLPLTPTSCYDATMVALSSLSEQLTHVLLL